MLMITGVVISAAVMALMGVVGINMSRTVGELDIALTEMESSTVIARTGEDGEIEDPSDPSHAAPLGESVRVMPDTDTGRVLAAAVGVQGMVMGIFVICLLVIISLVVRYWQRAHTLG